MKLLIPAVAAFVVGIGAGTGIVVMKGPPKSAATSDSTAVAHADSAAAGHLPDAVAHADPARDADAAAAHDAGAGAKAHATHEPPPAPVTLATVAAHASSPVGYAHVAKILGSMQAEDAAKILAFLDDDQVDGLLRTVGVRQAAALLQQLPPARAAALSRRLIQQPIQETH